MLLVFCTHFFFLIYPICEESKDATSNCCLNNDNSIFLLGSALEEVIFCLFVFSSLIMWSINSLVISAPAWTLLSQPTVAHDLRRCPLNSLLFRSFPSVLVVQLHEKRFMALEFHSDLFSECYSGSYRWNVGTVQNCITWGKNLGRCFLHGVCSFLLTSRQHLTFLASCQLSY